NLFYHRIGSLKFLIRPLGPGLSTLYMSTPKIGEGLFIQHGFSTIISAKSVGKNCWINQQVTIGYSNKQDRPTLMDNVTVYAGAKIIGNVQIGENSIIGANCVVVKNVPPNSTVVGVPAVIIKKNGVKCRQGL